MGRPAAWRHTSAVALLLGLTACGTTVPHADGLAQSSGDGLSALGPTEQAVTPGSPAAARATTPARPAGSTGPAAVTSTAGPAAVAPAPSTPVVAGLDGPGVTATTISLGLLYLKNANAEQAALGNTAATTGDIGTMMHILVDDLNAHGGIGGRRVVPVYHSVDATSSQTATQVAEAACADFTQDHHVFAAIGSGNPDLLACLQKAGSMAVLGGGGNLVTETSAQYNAHPANFDVIALSVDRLAADLVPVLVRTHYFDPWNAATGAPGSGAARVGILVPDRPEFHHGVDVLLAALRKAGVAVAPQDVAYFRWPQSTGEDAQAVADIQSYVLKFRTDGVTHVLPLEQNALVFFGAAADKQGYRPRYGLNSATAAQQYLGSLLPASQLNGAVGLGFFPNTDLAAADNPDSGPYSNPARRHCLDIMRRNGQSFSDTSAEADALMLCDSFATLRSLLVSVPRGTSWNQRTVSQALDRIGPLPSANLTSVRYGPGKRDAVSGGWVWQYDASCTCLRYSGSRFDLP